MWAPIADTHVTPEGPKGKEGQRNSDSKEEQPLKAADTARFLGSPVLGGAGGDKDRPGYWDSPGRGKPGRLFWVSRAH